MSAEDASTRGAFTASQVSAGCKNRLSIEIYGTKSSVAWNQERPDELWIGNRNTNNQVIIKDPSLLKPGAKPFADLPGGHSEGYDDTFKQVFRRFYQSIEDPSAEPQYPQFADGLRAPEQEDGQEREATLLQAEPLLEHLPVSGGGAAAPGVERPRGRRACLE